VERKDDKSNNVNLSMEKFTKTVQNLKQQCHKLLLLKSDPPHICNLHDQEISTLVAARLEDRKKEISFLPEFLFIYILN
jgi:hypothetical protein